MPFGKTTEEHTAEYWTKHFGGFLKPLIESAGKLQARRSEALRGDILRQIITDLVISTVVVADLTDANPNVYWELGVRQSFRHGTVTIAQYGTPLPFDIGAIGTLFYYPKNHLEMAEFEKRFGEAIDDCVTRPERPDSHVLETISGRGTMFEIIHREESIRRLDALLSELIHNETVLGKILETVGKNQKDKGNRTFPTVRFRLRATELLTTNRYLDQDTDFYTSAEEYQYNVLTWSDQLGLWGQSPGSTEEWFLEDLKASAVTESFQDFKKRVESAKKVLHKSR